MLKTFAPWQCFAGLGVYVGGFAFTLSYLSNLTEWSAWKFLPPLPFENIYFGVIFYSEE